MQMIDVLKRLAELDSSNPRVEKTMMPEQSLATVTNIDGESQLNECGPMGMGGMMPPHSPASFSVTANSGEELGSLLKDIVSLAGIKQSNISPEMHKEIEISAPHRVEPADDMSNMIGMIDKMNTSSDHNVDDLEQENLAGAVVGGVGASLIAGPEAAEIGAMVGDKVGDMMTSHDDDDQQEGIDDRIYDNSPEEEIEAHDYGDKQVKPKPNEPMKKHGGGNPYKSTHESMVSKIEAQLHKDWQEFVIEAAPSAGLSKKKKSEVVKKAKAGKDIGKKGKGFKAVASKAAKKYGSKEKGEKVAAAAMWKNVKR